jgi:P27 family predicted phage terminase small subunit
VANPAKPTALKLIEGNPGKRALPKNEPKPVAPNALPEPPERFGPDAVAEWLRTGPVLHKMGLITLSDLPMFEAYCEAWGGYVSAQRAYASEPLVEGQKGNLVRNPAAQISRDCLDKAISLARDFGMTPASRTRIDLPGGQASGAGLEGLLA